MKNYEEAEKLLTGRCFNSRKLDRNTYLIRKEDCIVIKLYFTNIVTFLKTGKTILTSGGWKTRVTKDQLNKFGPVQVFQHKSQWYIGSWNKRDKSSIFYDGITLNKKGNIEKVKVKDPKLAENLRLINRYCNLIKKMKILPSPNQGDCWICLLFDQNLKPGQKSTSVEHIINHLKQKYIYGSLIFQYFKMVRLSKSRFHLCPRL